MRIQRGASLKAQSSSQVDSSAASLPLSPPQRYSPMVFQSCISDTPVPPEREISSVAKFYPGCYAQIQLLERSFPKTYWFTKLVGCGMKVNSSLRKLLIGGLNFFCGR